MGFDSGITVYKRVIDEKRWLDFLHTLYDTYKSNSIPYVEFYCNYDREKDQFKPLGGNNIDWRAVHLCEQFNFPYKSSSFWATGAHVPLRQTSPSIYTWGPEEQEEQRRKTLPLLRTEADKLHYTIDDAQLAEWANRGIRPLDCMQFNFIESVNIPLYGHHFKGFMSKTRGGERDKNIYVIFNRFFPDHAYYFNELSDESVYMRGLTPYYNVPGSRYRTCISTETPEQLNQFYDRLINECAYGL
ncbi:unnamed protein product [Rotaria socialis]|uniref:Uncharacterized protein n=1 Tax=Rotaria socialis TaxID=392032 RepID=A0A818CT36_9BILA|nr:unnamed protein product [Rotaria socialis]CAF4929944.1 unnamed protein product [Rotaria socialis]